MLKHEGLLEHIEEKLKDGSKSSEVVIERTKQVILTKNVENLCAAIDNMSESNEKLGRKVLFLDIILALATIAGVVVAAVK